MNDVELRLLNSLAKVFPHKSPPAEAEKIMISALRGETVSVQAAYLYKENGHRSWARFTVDAPPGVNFSARLVRYMPGFISSNFRTDDGYLNEKGLFPDLLEPFETNRLPLVPGIWQCVWVSFEVDKNAASGTYPIGIKLERRDGGIMAAGEIDLEVIALELPPLDIPHTRWLHADCLAEYYGVRVFSERHWEIIENFVSYAVKHGINTILTPIHTPPLDTEISGERLTVQLIDVTVNGDGDFIFDFGKLERWVSMCRRVGIEYFEMAHLFTQWGAKHAPKIMGTKNGVYTRLFGWETDAAGGEYTRYLEQMLPALTVKLREWGIAEKTFFHISDEPGIKHLEAYTAAQNIVRPLLEGFKIVDALSDYEFYEKGAVSVPVPAVDYIEPFLKGNVRELWCYYCCVQSYKVPNLFFMQPSYRNRIIGVLLSKYNLFGFLHWGYNFYNCVHSVYPVDPFRITDADGAFPSGDAFIVYPGADGHPLASQRLMVALEAFNDLRALKLLEGIIGRERVLGLIEEGLDEPLSFTCFPQNEEYLLTLRRKVNGLIDN